MFWRLVILVIGIFGLANAAPQFWPRFGVEYWEGPPFQVVAPSAVVPSATFVHEHRARGNSLGRFIRGVINKLLRPLLPMPFGAMPMAIPPMIG